MWVVKPFSLAVFGRVGVLHRFSVLTPTDDSSDEERLTRLPSHKFWSSEYTARAFQLSVQSQRSRKEEITFLACSLKESSLLVHPAVPRSVGVPVSELLKFCAPPSAVPGCAACWKGARVQPPPPVPWVSAAACLGCTDRKGASGFSTCWQGAALSAGRPLLRAC